MSRNGGRLHVSHFRQNDASWAQQHLADGFVAGNSWGDWGTKDDFIKDLQKKNNKWKSGNISELQVATFGSNTAVSHYILPMTPDSGGRIGREL